MTPDRWLVVVAAPLEVRAVLDGLGGDAAALPDPWEVACVGDRFDVLHSGVGKANAAGATARVLDPRRHLGVLSVGIAGSLPGSGLGLCDAVGATRSILSDEGIGGDAGFISMSEVGFGAFPDGSMHAEHDPGLLEPFCTRTGPIATVSWCSGSDACAQGVVERTGAICEAMEGAAVALAARRIDPGIATAELRVISNTTGDRSSQRWALDDSLRSLRAVLGRIAQALC
ncbi:MAG: futalosine hydrolase [Phycisphaerae bacterium]|nr:futalosine hydrolase [Phycisphaerae bacterium]